MRRTGRHVAPKAIVPLRNVRTYAYRVTLCETARSQQWSSKRNLWQLGCDPVWRPSNELTIKKARVITLRPMSPPRLACHGIRFGGSWPGKLRRSLAMQSSARRARRLSRSAGSARQLIVLRLGAVSLTNKASYFQNNSFAVQVQL
jgi:hypothetical protein